MENIENNDATYEYLCLRSRLGKQVLLFVLNHMALWLLWFTVPHSNWWLALWPLYSMVAWGINLVFSAAELLMYRQDVPKAGLKVCLLLKNTLLQIGLCKK